MQKTDTARPKQAYQDETLPQADKLFNKNFVLLWQGQFVSKLGTQVYAIVIILWLTNLTNSASIVGLYGMAAGIPVVILSAFGGAVADRFSRKKIIIFCDILNGFAILSLAGLMFFAPDLPRLTVIWLFVVAVIAASINSFFGPAIGASIPDLVPKKQIAAANTMGQFSEKISVFIGQGLGGILYQTIGAPFVVLFDGISYLVSAFSETFIDIPQRIPEKAKSFREYGIKFKEDILEGFQYINRNRGLRQMLIATVFINFFSMPVIVLLPFYVKLHLQVAPDWYGFFMAIYGIGALLGYISAGVTKVSGSTRRNLLIFFMIAEPAGYILISQAHTITFAAILFLLGGIFSGYIMVNIVTLLQLTTPSQIRGRVFGVLSMISASVAPLGMGIGGVVADLTDKNIPLVYTICGATMILIITIFSFQRTFRDFISFETEEEQEETGFTYNIRYTTEEELLKNIDPKEVYLESRFQKPRSEL